MCSDINSLSFPSPPFPANEDYTSVNKTLTFSRNISTLSIFVNTTDDNIFEENELFQLVLSQPQVANERVTLMDTIITNITILDNDSEV